MNRLTSQVTGGFGDVFSVLSRRIGTAVGTYLVTLGLPQQLAEQLLLGAAVFAGVVLDFALDKAHDQRTRAEVEPR